MSDRERAVSDGDENSDGDSKGRSEDGSEKSRYVHQPRSSPPARARPPEGGFDWRGWVLVGVVLVAFFVVPVAILALPAARSLVASLGLTLRDAYLVLPLVPAFLLGAVAVWAAVRSRSA